MRNTTMTSVFINSFDSINRFKELKSVSVTTGGTNLFFDEKPFEIKVGDNKVKVSTLDFMEAFKDMLDTGVFELDQIDSAVWKVELELEEAQRKLEVAHE